MLSTEQRRGMVLSVRSAHKGHKTLDMYKYITSGGNSKMRPQNWTRVFIIFLSVPASLAASLSCLSLMKLE